MEGYAVTTRDIQLASGRLLPKGKRGKIERRHPNRIATGEHVGENALIDFGDLDPRDTTGRHKLPPVYLYADEWMSEQDVQA